MRCVLIFLLISLLLVACNEDKAPTKTIEIQQLINFDEAQPDALQTITDAKKIKIIKQTFDKARKFGEVDNEIVPQYKILIDDSEYYLWIDQTNTGTIANVNSRNMFYNILADDKFKAAINYQP